MEPAVVFDLGGVLIDWDPRHLYRQLLPDDDAVEEFLATVCTHAWNHEQDAGRSFAEAVELLVAEHPEHADLVRAFHDRWPEMLGDAFDETVGVLDALRHEYPVYALTNWSAETWPHAEARFPFLGWFRGVVVSGHEGVAKPDPRIYALFLERYGLDAASTIFIDDRIENVEAARRLGIDGILHTDALALGEELSRRGIVLPV